MNIRTFWQLPAHNCSADTATWLQTFVKNFKVDAPITVDLQTIGSHTVQVALKASQVTFYTSQSEHEVMLRLKFGENIYCMGTDEWG